ncbi:MAG TPA: urease accessory protein UreD, partial [Acidimicrobiales bacterium]|nr:urease accessory protein UreD [Acidimicrobiales bacterium]
MTSVMEAWAEVVADTAAGRTRLRTLRSDPPVALRPAGGAVYLASSAAGPVGGDRVDLDVTVEEGAVLELRSVGATMAWPGPTGAPSTATVTAGVGPRAALRWLPEPVVAVAGCEHRMAARVTLAADARLLWREELVLGRHGEAGGSVL